MPDVTRSHPSARPDPEPDRDVTIESLLVSGLDLYFAGEYERAVHAWTRVLFLDRSHARARAYIDRARLVLAERQRQSDVLLHEAMAAFDAGDTGRARTLLEQAALRGGQGDQALTLRDRIDRLDAPVALATAPAQGNPTRPAAPAPAQKRTGTRRRSWPWLVLFLALGTLVALAWPRIVEWAAEEVTPPAASVPAPADVALPVPRASDLLLSRAASLFARGHLHEALDVAEQVPVDDVRRAEADRLRADIQRVLLGHTAGPDAAAAPVAARPDEPR